MKRAFPIFSLLLLSSIARLADAEILWRGDFENGDFSLWNGVTNEKKGDRVNIAVVEDVVTEGTKACRFEIHGDDDFSSTQSRTQLTRRSQRTGEGGDVYMASYWRMPADAKYRNQIQYWESDGYKNNVDFWVEPKEGGGTVINFGTGSLGKDKHWSADFTLNQWHLIAHHIHWSQNAQEGSITVWYDGKVVVNAIKLATKPDGQALFTQLGFHRAQRSDLVDAIYLDGVIEADSEADLLALPVPMMAGGGAGGGGAGGMSGTAGAAGSSGAGGSGGSAAGSAGAGAGGLGGAWEPPNAGTGGAPVQAGSGGATSTPGAAPNQTNSDDAGGCSVASPARSSSPVTYGSYGVLLLAALAAYRRARRR